MSAAKSTAPHVYQAISWVTSELKKVGIGKDQRNKEQGFNFRGIDQVYQALCGLLSEAQLIVTPRVVDAKFDHRESKSGTKMFNTFLTVEYDFISSVDGSKHTTRVVGEATDSGDKGSNKAMSAAYKYNAIQAFAIPVKGEPDADEHTNEETVAEPAQRPAQKPRQRTQAAEPAAESQSSQPAQEPVAEADTAEKISALQQAEVTLLLERSGADTAAFFKYYGVTDVGGLPEASFKAIVGVLNEKILRKTRGAEGTKPFKGVRT